MKYKIENDLAAALNVVSQIEKYLKLEKNNLTITYAKPMHITNSEHAQYDHYVIPVSVSGWLKCDQLFDASDLHDIDTTWFQTTTAE